MLVEHSKYNILSLKNFAKFSRKVEYYCYGEAMYDSHHACTFIHGSWWDSLGNGISAFICSLQNNLSLLSSQPPPSITTIITTTTTCHYHHHNHHHLSLPSSQPKCFFTDNFRLFCPLYRAHLVLKFKTLYDDTSLHGKWQLSMGIDQPHATWHPSVFCWTDIVKWWLWSGCSLRSLLNQTTKTSGTILSLFPVRSTLLPKWQMSWADCWSDLSNSVDQNWRSDSFGAASWKGP